MRILAPIALCVVALPVVSLAYREGPLPNMTGGFGDPNCSTCHFGSPLNAPGGRLLLSGVPASYVAGRTYPLIVTLRKKGLERGGFEIAARFASGPQKGKQAGAWTISKDGLLQTINGQQDPTLVFVQHTTAGTAAKTTGTISWTLEWTAPVSGGPVQFNVAANATNDDASPIGDGIYTIERTIQRSLAAGPPGHDLISGR
jgi:hypothetical protein